LVECEGEYVVRAVQAKAGYGRARPRFVEATTKYKALQEGKYDSFWNDRVRQFRLELKAEGTSAPAGSTFPASQLAHFSVSIAHAVSATTAPGHDFSSRIVAHAPDGRALVLFQYATLREMISRIAESIRGRLP
jgi:hypothetical protein